MGQVTITLNGRAYRMSCGAGEEDRLHELARDLDRRLEHLATDFGQHGNERLLVMAALLLTDELMELKAAAPSTERAASGARDSAPPAVPGEPAAVAEASPGPVGEDSASPPQAESAAASAAAKHAPRAGPQRLSLEARLAEARAGRTNPAAKPESN